MVAYSDTMPKEEYRVRQDRLRDVLGEEQLDGIVINCEDSIYYFTGARSFELFQNYVRPFVLVLPREGEPELIVNDLWLEAAKRTSYVQRFTACKQLRVPSEAVSSVLKRMGLASKRVGTELGYESVTSLSHDHERGARSLNGLTVEASRAIWKVRMLKSNLEVARIRQACRILQQAFERCFEASRPGMTEREVVRILFSEMTKLGAEGTAFLIMSSGPYNYDVGWGPGDYKLQEGNTVTIDSGAVYLGYRSDYSRTASVGKPSSRQLAKHKAAHELNGALVDGIKPGMKASEAMSIYRREAKARGVASLMAEASGFVGHGIGLLTIEPPLLVDGDETILKPGMVLTPEISLNTDYGKFFSEEVVLVTESGSEPLSPPDESLYEIR